MEIIFNIIIIIILLVVSLVPIILYFFLVYQWLKWLIKERNTREKLTKLNKDEIGSQLKNLRSEWERQ